MTPTNPTNPMTQPEDTPTLGELFKSCPDSPLLDKTLSEVLGMPLNHGGHTKLVDLKAHIVMQHRETALVLYALRYLQTGFGNVQPYPTTEEFGIEEPITAEEIDTLCEKINFLP